MTEELYGLEVSGCASQGIAGAPHLGRGGDTLLKRRVQVEAGDIFSPSCRLYISCEASAGCVTCLENDEYKMWWVM